MSKRRINKQQTARIQKIQANYRQQLQNENDSPTERGLVITRLRRHAVVEQTNGELVHCSIRPNIDSLVAGDEIVWQKEGERGVVLSRFPRKSELNRPDKRNKIKPIAANITQVILVVAAKPELVWSLLDSYLVMIEHLKLEPCLVLNKVDLASKTLQQEFFELYQPLGYRILFTSSKKNIGFQQLKQTLNNHTSVFVGQSGVGKSSLISTILPHEMNIQTAEISESSELGCHTTSNSQLYHLPSGGQLIDSPGIRELGLWHMSDSEIVRGYREFRPLVQECKFRNCTHKNSPGCAIISAVTKGKIAQKRYDTFLKLSSLFGDQCH